MARAVRGLIPTHAGKTLIVRQAWEQHKAHPHSRGENAASDAIQFDLEGSSPLTRGKRSVLTSYVGRVGLIPTHAGKTRAKCNSSNPARAHPHSRGENDGGQARGCLYQGSSPLTRGKRGSLARFLDGRGLIPTHAGKTLTERLEK